MSPCRFQSPLLPLNLPKPPIKVLEHAHYIRSIHLHSRAPFLALHCRPRLQAWHPACQVVAGLRVVRMAGEGGVCVRAGEGQTCTAAGWGLGAAASAWIGGVGAGLADAVRRCTSRSGKCGGGAAGGEGLAK